MLKLAVFVKTLCAQNADGCIHYLGFGDVFRTGCAQNEDDKCFRLIIGIKQGTLCAGKLDSGTP